MIVGYLNDLSKPFNVQWVSRFLAFMKFLLKNHEALRVIGILQKEKFADHKSFSKTSCSLIHGLNTYLGKLQEDDLKHFSIDKLASKLKSLEDFCTCLKTYLEDPFFQGEDLFYDMKKSLLELLQGLFHDHKLKNIQDAYILSLDRGICQAKLILSFSEDLKNCELEAERLRGVREVAIWGKWDRLLHLFTWVKNGVSNDTFGKNLRNIFYNYHYDELIQDVGRFFQEEFDSLHLQIKKTGFSGLFFWG